MNNTQEQFPDEQYTSIIPTAYLTAYPRTLTDIPYSKEIFEELEKLRAEQGKPVLGEDIKVQRLAPELEARSKLIDKLLRDIGIDQILELAAGLSSRGLVMTTDSAVKYTELDLPDMAELKREVLMRVTTISENLHIVSGNALRLADMEKAVESFDANKQLAVINEGLLRYLGFDEKAQVAKNIRYLLEKFGGVWITCDTTPKKFLATQDSVTAPGFNKSLAVIAGKDFQNNMFQSNEHVEEFFGGLGFSVEFHNFTEIEDELSSPEAMGLSAEEVREMLGSAVVVVMRLVN